MIFHAETSAELSDTSHVIKKFIETRNGEGSVGAEVAVVSVA